MALSDGELLAAYQEQQSQNRTQWELFGAIGLGLLTLLYTSDTTPILFVRAVLAAAFVSFQLSNSRGLAEGTRFENDLLDDIVSRMRERKTDTPRVYAALVAQWTRPLKTILVSHDIAGAAVVSLIVGRGWEIGLTCDTVVIGVFLVAYAFLIRRERHTWRKPFERHYQSREAGCS